MPRLFTAITVSEDVADQLLGLDQPMPGARWADADQFHVTLRFLGDVDNSVAREFAAELETITVEPFELRLVGVGAFGGNEPRSLWAGVAPSEALSELARAHERAARNAGLPPETRNFMPHVTLARLRRTPVDVVARYLSRHGAFKSKPFLVDRFVLYLSKPKVGGGPYVTEAEYGLGADWSDEAARW